MSERRFWFVIDKGKLDYVQDNVTGENITVTELEDLLNALSEENEQLKHYKLYEDNKRLQTIIADLKEENEKLRNIHLSIDLTYSYGYGKYLANVRVIDDE